MILWPFPPQGWEKAFDDLPAGYVGYTTSGAWVNNCTSVAAPSLESIVETIREHRARQAEIDTGLADALGRHIAGSGQTLASWADRLGVSFLDLVGVLDGVIRPIPWYFWEQVRRTFEPMRNGAFP